jgi:hypothetical protein
MVGREKEDVGSALRAAALRKGGRNIIRVYAKVRAKAKANAGVIYVRWRSYENRPSPDCDWPPRLKRFSPFQPLDALSIIVYVWKLMKSRLRGGGVVVD